MGSTLLAGVLALSLLSISSLAADSTGNDIQEMVVDGVTYFNANNEHFEDSNRLFFQDLLSNQNANLQDEESDSQKDGEETPVPQSTDSLWQYLAYAIQDRNGQGTSDGKLKTQFDDVLKKSLVANTGKVTGDSTSTSSGHNDYDVHWTGLQYAGSIASAARQMEDNLFDWYRDAGGGRKDMYATDSQSDEDAATKTSDTSATTFSPDTPCTRGQIVTFLWNHAGNPKISQGNDFVDVAYSDYFHNAVKCAGFAGADAGNEHALRHLHGLCGVRALVSGAGELCAGQEPL